MTVRTAILACLAVCFALAPIASAQTPLKIMTFNVRYGTANDGDNHWDKRKDILVNTIKNADPDIIGMQECLDFQAAYVQSALPGYEHFGVGREVNGGGERMEIFFRASRLAPVETHHFWLSETPDVPGSRSWMSANVRMASWARFYDREDRRFFYYLNTHLDHKSEEARANAAKILADWAKSTLKSGPLIITGDFNSAAEKSVPYATLTTRLQDAWLQAAERVGPALTWCGFAPPAAEGDRIDWILVSPGVAVSRAETVIHEESGRYPSDHFPVTAGITLPKPKK